MGGAKTSPNERSSYLRTIRKPLMERKRRERMNQSIDQLKDLIADTIKQNVAPMTRVDKADILELTVMHLFQANQQQQQHRIVAPTTNSPGYSTGYQDCAQEVVNFLANNSLVDGATFDGLNAHLNNIQQYISINGQASGIPPRPARYCSTPVRPRHFEEATTATPVHLNGYSPIPQTFRDISDIRGHSSSIGSRNTWVTSNSSSSSNGAESSGEFRSYSSMDYSSEMSNSGSRNSSYGVSIGKGKTNAIGHVIMDTPWRPW